MFQITRRTKRYTRIKEVINGLTTVRTYTNQQPEEMNMEETKPHQKKQLLDIIDKLNEAKLYSPTLRVKSKTVPVIIQSLQGILAAVTKKQLKGVLEKSEIKFLKKSGIEFASNDSATEPTEEGVTEEFQEAPEERKENNELFEKIDKLQAIVNDEDAKKKKRKKAAKQLKQLLTDNKVELAAGDSKPKTKSTTRTSVTRADRKIPKVVSWPREDTITGTIVKFCQKKPRTLKQVIKQLEKKFPERPVEGMTKTVGALIGGKGLPLPLHYTKGIECVVENDGTPEKTVFIPVTK